MRPDGKPLDPLDWCPVDDGFTHDDLDEVVELLTVLEFVAPPYRDEVAVQSLRRLAAHIRTLPK